MTIVIDASIALGWTHATPPPDAVYAQERLVDDDALVPSIWPAEVANGLLVAERRGLMTAEHRAAFLALLRKVNIGVEATGAERTLSVALNLARDQQLSVYDAMYLELARREGVPLASLDGPLRDAARRIGVTLLDADGSDGDG